MANIIITSVGNYGIYVDFGVYDSEELPSPQGFNTRNIVTVKPTNETDGVYVFMEGKDAQIWKVCHTSKMGYLTIDLIDGVAPTSQSDLINKLTALM